MPSPVFSSNIKRLSRQQPEFGQRPITIGPIVDFQPYYSVINMYDVQSWYRDEIWGKRALSDDALFEVMSLQVFQAGLNWQMILDKRDAFRSAFCSWSIEAVASFDLQDIEILLNNKDIIRNRLKIRSAVYNARAILAIQAEYGSFCAWFYDVLDLSDYPSLQRILKKSFSFMGPEIARMWLLASGRISPKEGAKYEP